VLIKSGVDGASVLDVGSGIGMISIELLARGARSAVLADASPATLEVARKLAVERSVEDRVQFVAGDFVETAQRLAPADIVVLDRAVCCYPAWRPLLTAATERCGRRLALTYPRSRLDVKFVIGLENLRRRLARNDFRAFVHSPRQMDASLQESGFRRILERRTFAWQIDLYSRA
jgi:magnesium-protoporphyrin O-methyltransferase